ncbi:uncharacterized protein I303_102345 [Kwoniella dejecticola CBS 10117]|uniref:Ricin B lectin domain-containing protein n=1 Tax=Kwoniella dejecticola CBS 10117 TaxID=1296121 RepID=A0A1A6AB75_9TREE|nr:uncharacterized protein I303_01514 [Kwoniella dejecticola CBS 10117]OBR87312.1 hypothetical protein I303_01514 [Kwoniella dejecticola CBS 10117]
MIFAYLFVLATSLLAVLASPLDLNKRYTSVRIQSYRDGKCLTPSGSAWTNGTPVVAVNCSQAARWNINPGSGSVILYGTNYALDAGLGTQNNEGVKLWTSYPGLFQQTWYLTNDNRIALSGGNQCLDEGLNGPQTYQCTTGNTNQIWYILQGNNLGATPVPLPHPVSSAAV